MGVGGERHASAALPLGKSPGTVVQEAGEAPGPVSGRVWRRENLLPPPEFWPRTVQSVASRYSDYEN
jgi:hypothetical protein